MAKQQRVVRELSEIKAKAARDVLEDLAIRVRSVKDEIDLLEAERKLLMTDVVAAIKRHKLGRIDTISAEDWDIVKTRRPNRRLNQKRLIEKGVSLALIEECTDENPSVSYSVSKKRGKKS